MGERTFSILEARRVLVQVRALLADDDASEADFSKVADDLSDLEADLHRRGSEDGPGLSFEEVGIFELVRLGEEENLAHNFNAEMFDRFYEEPNCYVPGRGWTVV